MRIIIKCDSNQTEGVFNALKSKTENIGIIIEGVKCLAEARMVEFKRFPHVIEMELN